MHPTPSPRVGLGLLGLVVLISVGWSMAWVSLHAANTPRDDDANLFQLALWAQQVLDGQVRLADGPPAMTPYPPLIPLLAALSFELGSRSVTTAVLSSWPFILAISLFSGLGVQRHQGTTAGLAAAALAPVLTCYWQVRGQFYAEIPLAACVLVAVVALDACDGFRHRGWSVVLGLSLGLGLLTKWTFAFFLGPVVAVAAAIGVARLARARPAQIGLGLLTLTVVGTVAGAAMGRVYGVVPLGLGLLLTGGLIGLKLRRGLDEGAGPRLVGLLLVLGLTVGLAAPWYVWQLDTLRTFLANNVGQTYDGDLPSLREGWIYYPAVLFTRFLDTPQVILLIFGVIRCLLPGRSRLAWLCLVTLLCGLTALGVAPYRNHRYLVAALGLLAPILVGALGSGKGARVLAPIILAYGLHLQQSWVLAMAGSAERLWELSTPPRRDLFGNHRNDVAQARIDLLHPQFSLQLVANPPMQEPSAARRIAGIVARAAPPGVPWEVRFSDPQGLLTCDPLYAELAARGAPSGSGCHPLQGGQRGGSARFIVEVSSSGTPGWEPRYRERVKAWQDWRHVRLGSVTVRGFAPGMEGLATVWRAP